MGVVVPGPAGAAPGLRRAAAGRAVQLPRMPEITAELRDIHRALEAPRLEHVAVALRPESPRGSSGHDHGDECHQAHVDHFTGWSLRLAEKINVIDQGAEGLHDLLILS